LCDLKKKGLGISIWITLHVSATVLTHSFNSHGYHIFWKQYRFTASLLLIGLLKAIGKRSQNKSTFLCIRILGTALSVFYVSFLSDLIKIWVLFQPCVLNLMNINVFLVSLLVFVTHCLVPERLHDVTRFIITWLFPLQKNLEKFVQDCYDAIALFLCVHLILRYQLMCHKRAVPALDQYWDKLQNVIWPRYVTRYCGK